MLLSHPSSPAGPKVSDKQDLPKDDETKFNETLKRMLETPPKPHRESDPERDKKSPSRTNKKRESE